jgi:hypothetical protein
MESFADPVSMLGGKNENVSSYGGWTMADWTLADELWS